MQDFHDKRAVYKKQALFIRKLDLNLRENQENAMFEAQVPMMLNLGNFGK
jgi:hypothetical protein